MSAQDPGMQLMQLISGMWVSQGVATMARLGIPDKLADGPQTATSLAADAGCDETALYRMMRALAKVGLFEQVGDDQFKLTEMGQLLRQDHERSLRWMSVAQCDPGHWRPWGHALDCVKSGEAQAEKVLGHMPWDYMHRNPEEAGRFGQAMTNMSQQAIAGITSNYDFSGFKQIVDVGGSHGTLLAAMLNEAPDASGVVFDLPPVVDMATRELAEHPLRSRMELVPGNFFDGVPEGADLYTLKHIIHDWNDEKAEGILRSIRKGIKDDGTLLVFDAVLAPQAPPFAFWLDVHMMVMLDGKERTPEEFGGLLKKAGFELTRIIPTGSPVAIVEAKPI